MVVIAQEGRPMTNVALANQSQGPNRQSVVQEDVPGSFTGTDKHCRNKVQRGILKYLRRKLLLLPH